jgi:hypothetical protein
MLHVLSVSLYFRRVRKIAKSDCYLRHVCVSVRMEYVGTHWTHFHEMRYLSIFRKSVGKIQVSLKPDMNNGTLHENICTFVIKSF